MVSNTSNVITYKEWLEMADGKEEVVDGQIVKKMPPAQWDQSLFTAKLQAVFMGQLDETALVMTGTFGLVIRKDLAVEVLSPRNTRKDVVRKTEDYESIGVPELWICSPEGRTFEVLQLQDGKLRTTQIVNSGQLRPLRFPETVVDVASVWPD